MEEPVRTLTGLDSTLLRETASQELRFDFDSGSNEIRSSGTGVEEGWGGERDFRLKEASEPSAESSGMVLRRFCSCVWTYSSIIKAVKFQGDRAERPDLFSRCLSQVNGSALSKDLRATSGWVRYHLVTFDKLYNLLDLRES